jgi:hypothetical protein
MFFLCSRDDGLGLHGPCFGLVEQTQVYELGHGFAWAWGNNNVSNTTDQIKWLI